jgi:hypothetical protein
MLKNDFESQNFAIFEDIVHNFGRYDALRPEGSENIPILFQGADLDFSNQNDLRNPKMNLKQSVPVATEKCFFQITFLGN